MCQSMSLLKKSWSLAVPPAPRTKKSEVSPPPSAGGAEPFSQLSPFPQFWSFTPRNRNVAANVPAAPTNNAASGQNTMQVHMIDRDTEFIVSVSHSRMEQVLCGASAPSKPDGCLRGFHKPLK